MIKDNRYENHNIPVLITDLLASLSKEVRSDVAEVERVLRILLDHVFIGLPEVDTIKALQEIGINADESKTLLFVTEDIFNPYLGYKGRVERLSFKLFNAYILNVKIRVRNSSDSDDVIVMMYELLEKHNITITDAIKDKLTEIGFDLQED